MLVAGTSTSKRDRVDAALPKRVDRRRVDVVHRANRRAERALKLERLGSTVPRSAVGHRVEADSSSSHVIGGVIIEKTVPRAVARLVEAQ